MCGSLRFQHPSHLSRNLRKQISRQQPNHSSYTPTSSFKQATLDRGVDIVSQTSKRGSMHSKPQCYDQFAHNPELELDYVQSSTSISRIHFSSSWNRLSEDASLACSCILQQIQFFATLLPLDNFFPNYSPLHISHFNHVFGSSSSSQAITASLQSRSRPWLPFSTTFIHTAHFSPEELHHNQKVSSRRLWGDSRFQRLIPYHSHLTFHFSQVTPTTKTSQPHPQRLCLCLLHCKHCDLSDKFIACIPSQILRRALPWL